jgi:hypothetical protein
MGSLTALKTIGAQPKIIWIGQTPLLLYLSWPALLPLSGGFGAHLSRRAGGNSGVCVIAGLFPAIVLFCLICLGLAGMAMKDQLDHPHWLYIAVGLFNWAILPGIASLVGVAPFILGCGPPVHN